MLYVIKTNIGVPHCESLCILTSVNKSSRYVHKQLRKSDKTWRELGEVTRLAMATKVSKNLRSKTNF